MNAIKNMHLNTIVFIVVISGIITHSTIALSHGDVTPQLVNTKGLPKLGDEWLSENPWRDPDSEFWTKAITIGASGYNQNCARCHGLEGISGGLAPDLRYLSADFDGDEWYVERFQSGMIQNGITKMPAFGDLLSQEAAWAIRTYLETRPDDGALDAHQTRLQVLKTKLKEIVLSIEGGATIKDPVAKGVPIRKELLEINTSIETASGAPVAESAVNRAAIALDGSQESFLKAAEILTIGLSAAQ